MMHSGRRDDREVAMMKSFLLACCGSENDSAGVGVLEWTKDREGADKVLR